MAVYRCPNCSIPYVDSEIEQGVCPSCSAPLGPPPGQPQRDTPRPTPTAASPSRRTVPFLMGLLVGCLIGSAALWAMLRLGAPLPGVAVEQTAALQDVQAQKADADKQARESESARAEAVKALEAANRKAAAALEQQEDAEQQFGDALALLAAERGHRAALEKPLAEQKKSPSAPTLSFIRDWQLLGPFASTGEQAHDMDYPPEREPVQLEKAYDGFSGRVKWQPYHSPKDKIDLADFFQYREAGAAYAVSWAYSDGDQVITLGLGSDDGVRVWVNGEKVHDIKGGRQARPGQDVVKAHLKKGWNEIRAKVDNIVGTWELYLEFRTADGTRPLKLFSTSTPPPAIPGIPTGEPPLAVNHLLRLMRDRLALMHHVSRSKWNSKRPISDPQREDTLLHTMETAGQKRGLEPRFTRTFFAAQMAAARRIQEADHARWREEKRGPFRDAPDLASLRKRIDSLNQELLDTLAEARPQLAEARTRERLRKWAQDILKDEGITDDIRMRAVEPLTVP